MWQQNVLPRMILCMSSDEDELFQVGILLRNAGYEPFLCVEAPDALRSLSYFEVELIIADELLDTGAGLSVLKKARSFIRAFLSSTGLRRRDPRKLSLTSILM